MSKLSIDEIKAQLAETLPAWHYDANANLIQRQFLFQDYYHCMAFVNALAFFAHQSNHHPDLEVSYGSCLVKYSTHDANGVTNQDIQAAKKADTLA